MCILNIHTTLLIPILIHIANKLLLIYETLYISENALILYSVLQKLIQLKRRHATFSTCAENNRHNMCFQLVIATAQNSKQQLMNTSSFTFKRKKTDVNVHCIYECLLSQMLVSYLCVCVCIVVKNIIIVMGILCKFV